MKTALALSILSSLLTQAAFANDTKVEAKDPNARPSVTVLTKEQAQNNVADTAKVVITTTEKPVASAPVKTEAPKAPAPSKKVAVRKAAPKRGSVLAVPMSELSQKPVMTARPGKTAAVSHSKVSSKHGSPDLAAEALKACVLKEAVQKKSAITCMNQELRDAEALLDSALVRVYNCAELRKIQKAGDAQAISQLISARRAQLDARSEAQFKAELQAAGSVGARKTREIELRATLAHLNAVTKLGNKVCDAQAFSTLLAK